MESLVKNVTDIILEEDRLKYKSQKEITSSNRVSAQGDGVATVYAGAAGGKGKQEGAGESGPAGGASGSGTESVQASGAAKAPQPNSRNPSACLQIKRRCTAGPRNQPPA